MASQASLKRAFPGMTQGMSYHIFNQWYELWTERHDFPIFEFENLFKVDTLSFIWRHVFGSIDHFNKEKARHFIELNIQVQRDESLLTEKIKQVKSCLGFH